MYHIEGFDPPDVDYCEAQFVMGVQKGKINLHISGRYRAPGSEAWMAFSVATPEAYGAFVPIIAPNGEVFRGRLGAYRAVTVVRPSSGWFDGVDLSTANGVAIGRAVLRRIANGTTVTLQR